MKIYLASSWRNPYQQAVVGVLRAAGHTVYDFKDPHPTGVADRGRAGRGFHWSEIDPDYRRWKPADLRAALEHQIAADAFGSDSDAVAWCEVCVLLLPSGRSAHLEAGWAAGAGKPLLVLAVDDVPIEPELMYRWGQIVCGVDELVQRLAELDAIRVAS